MVHCCCFVLVQVVCLFVCNNNELFRLADSRSHVYTKFKVCTHTKKTNKQWLGNKNVLLPSESMVDSESCLASGGSRSIRIIIRKRISSEKCFYLLNELLNLWQILNLASLE